MLQRRSENEEFVEVGRLAPSDYFGEYSEFTVFLEMLKFSTVDYVIQILEMLSLLCFSLPHIKVFISSHGPSTFGGA